MHPATWSLPRRAVDLPDAEKLQQAKALLEAADGEVLGAQSLPVGSDWPVVSLVCGQLSL